MVQLLVLRAPTALDSLLPGIPLVLAEVGHSGYLPVATERQISPLSSFAAGLVRFSPGRAEVFGEHLAKLGAAVPGDTPAGEAVIVGWLIGLDLVTNGWPTK